MLHRLTVSAWTPDRSYPLLSHVFVGATQEEICALFEQHAKGDSMLREFIAKGAITCCWDCCQPGEAVPGLEPPAPTPGIPPVPPGFPTPPGGRRPEAVPVRPPGLRPVTPGRRPEAQPIPPPVGRRPEAHAVPRTGRRPQAGPAFPAVPLRPPPAGPSQRRPSAPSGQRPMAGPARGDLMRLGPVFPPIY